MLHTYLIAAARLYPLALPVKIVELELYEFNLRVIRQHTIQQLRLVMIGKSRVPYQSFRLLLLQPLKAFELLVLDDLFLIDRMQQVIVKVACARLFKLLVEYLVSAFKGVEIFRMQLRRQCEALSGMAVYECLLRRILALKSHIHPRGIEVCKSIF